MQGWGCSTYVTNRGTLLRVLADFVAEFTPPLSSVVGLRSMSDRRQWKVLVDRASNAKGSRVGIVMISPKGIKLEKSLRLGF